MRLLLKVLGLAATIGLPLCAAAVLAAHYESDPDAGEGWRDQVRTTLAEARGAAAEASDPALWLWAAASTVAVLACASALASICRRNGRFDGRLWFGLVLIFGATLGGAWHWMFWEAASTPAKTAATASWLAATAAVRLTAEDHD